MSDVVVSWSPRMQGYNPSEDDQRPLRRQLAWDLLAAIGALDEPGIRVAEPVTATDPEVARVHAEPYIRAVRRYSAKPSLAAEWEAPQWGFIPGMDTVAREGMHEAAALVCGAAQVGARAIWRAEGSRAFCPAPAGLHHALANRASGFCIYNDCALAVRELLDLGAERVAYVDIDAHHGDGVQWIFYEDARVLSVSVHQFAHGFFPGTGGLSERGSGVGVGSTINVPLPAFAGDEPFLAAFESVVVPAVERFAPQALVVHLGADVHHADPLAHLQVTLAALERIYADLAALADRAASGRLLAIAGGGYNPMTLGRIWALQLAALAGREANEDLPEDWREAMDAALGAHPPRSLRDDRRPDVDSARTGAADAEGLRAVSAAQALLGA